MTELYVITGGPGTGKTSVIEMLKKHGVYVISEAAARIIEKEENSKKSKKEKIIPKNKDKLPEFQKMVFDTHSNDLKCINPETEKAFLDRSHIDNAAYCEYYGISFPEGLEKSINSANYKKAYILEQPSEKFYIKTGVRIEDYAEANIIHGKICDAYKKYLKDKIANVPLMVDSNIESSVLNNGAELDKVIFKRMTYILKDIKGIKQGINQ